MKTELKTKREALLEELVTLGSAVRGTIIFSRRKCSRKTCECHRKKAKMHPFRYLSTAKGVGKNTIVYVKESEISMFSTAIEEYKRIKEIIEELSTINIQLIKSGGEHEE